MTIKPAFDIGDFVYLQTDAQQLKRIVTGIKVRRGVITYLVSCGDMQEMEYWDFELSHQKDLMLELGINKETTA